MSSELLIPGIAAIYLAVFIAPFVQEDAAVVGSASAASLHEADAAGIFIVSLLGLVLSDAWKYWAGYHAQSWPPAARWVRNPRVAALREAVLGRLAVALLGARFIPGARIPLYLACGVFRAPFHRFLPLITLTGALYLGLSFALFAVLGDLAGVHFQRALPFVGVGLLVAFTLSAIIQVVRNRAKHRRIPAGLAPIEKLSSTTDGAAP